MKHSGSHRPLTLLGWGASADGISRAMLVEAVTRMGASAQRVKRAHGMRKDPFAPAVHIYGGDSEHARQQACVRQGCPLSPRLFFSVSKVMVHCMLGEGHSEESCAVTFRAHTSMACCTQTA